ncbi:MULTISPECIES: hypothetical protein [unclassified Cellulophaga]|uniref:hypothetical protein n=1 Tax=unclassified Cellulophaga TaxID=2634405 RepID=UPI0026E1ECFB|nr:MULTISPECIES: hypothetical protein [unclassified Cellulophaga]MDO6491697.1 hypothetical protein [Cellulophaga sp. 2_MG-2023]MDO6495648.1 hypothetical protein [Cellulophaga sp. 3_MG-2023]
MKNLSEFLYGTESSEKMQLFDVKIKKLNEKHEEILNGERVESKFFVDWTAGKNINKLQITDNELNVNIANDINQVFNDIFK